MLHPAPRPSAIRTAFARLILAALFASVLASPAVAESNRPSEPSTGFVVEWSPRQTVLGNAPWRSRGRLLEVRGIAELVPASGEQVRAVFVHRDRHQSHTTATAPVRTDRGGYFELTGRPPIQVVSVQLQVQSNGRFHTFGTSPLRADRSPRAELRTDRQRYEPGETAQITAWQFSPGGSLQPGTAELHVSHHGRQIHRESLRIGPSGAAQVSFTFEAGMQPGPYVFRIGDQSTQVTLEEREEQSMMVDVALDARVVAPGTPIEGTITVTTPAGDPIAGATVLLNGGEAQSTDRRGRLSFRLPTPQSFTEEVLRQSLQVAVSHPSVGRRNASTSYQVARNRWVLTLLPETGQLIPGIPTRGFVSVLDHTGAPAPEGTRITVEGRALPGSSFEGQTNALGLLEVPLNLPDGAYEGCNCATFRGDIHGADGQETHRLSVGVNARAQAFARAPSRVAPGETITVEILRRRDAARRSFLLRVGDARDALEVVNPGQSRVRIRIPETSALNPILSVHLEPFAQDQGDRLVSVTTASYVQPESSFELSIESDAPSCDVRAEAAITVERSTAALPTYFAWVVRDLAMHDGEIPWATELSQRLLKEALTGDSIALRGGLATFARNRSLGANVYSRAQQQRNRLITRLGVLLEDLVLNADVYGELLQGNRFRPDLLQSTAIRAANLRNAGGALLTLAMIQRTAPELRFDVIARRVARNGLAPLMVAIAQAAEGEQLPEDAPERWLSELVRQGRLTAREITDPWGTPYSFRRTPGARFVLSAHAPNFQVVSAGPDRRFGTRDDLSDPFARVVPEDSLYARFGGENQLMRRLSALATGEGVLAAMGQAYEAETAAMSRARNSVSRSNAEGSMDFAADGMSVRGVGRGGGGVGYGTIGLAPAPAEEPSMRSSLAPRRARQAETAELEQSLDDDVVNEPASPFGAIAGRIRRDFPATLHVLPPTELDGDRMTLAVPLADALTTYRLEAIAWNSAGIFRNASTEFRVRQAFTVDAPIPNFAREGDTLIIPVRFANHSDDPRQVRIAVEGEGLGLESEAHSLQLEANSTGRHLLEVRIGAPTGDGEGLIRVGLFDAQNGDALDAVERPIALQSPGRPTAVEHTGLIDGSSFSFDLPNDASPHGEGHLRFAEGLFLPPEGNLLHQAWLRALARRPLTEEQRQHAENALHSGNPQVLPMALAALWDTDIDNAVLKSSFERLVERPRLLNFARHTLPMAFAPVLRSNNRRALKDELAPLFEHLREENAATLDIERSPERWAAAAAFFAASSESTELAGELIRRCERHLLGFADRSFLPAATPEGIDLMGTGHLMSAYALLGRHDEAAALLRTLIDANTDVLEHRHQHLTIATGGATLLTGQIPSAIRIDDQRLEVNENGTVSLPALGSGAHRIAFEGTEGLLLATLRVPFALPWDAPVPPNQLRAELAFDGNVGALDHRAGLRLTVRNRSPQLLQNPEVVIQLPAGARLDEGLRNNLHFASPATVEGSALRLRLRPLTPGAFVRIPLPIQWSTAGELQGLGTTLSDNSIPFARRPAPAMLQPRSVEVALEGGDETPAEAESGAPPEPPPPPPPIECYSPSASLFLSPLQSSQEHWA